MIYTLIFLKENCTCIGLIKLYSLVYFRSRHYEKMKKELQDIFINKVKMYLQRFEKSFDDLEEFL
jgi:hypothetical protein